MDAGEYNYNSSYGTGTEYGASGYGGGASGAGEYAAGYSTSDNYNYGDVPAASNYGDIPATSNYGDVPAASNYGDIPATSNYGEAAPAADGLDFSSAGFYSNTLGSNTGPSLDLQVDSPPENHYSAPDMSGPASSSYAQSSYNDSYAQQPQYGGSYQETYQQPVEQQQQASSGSVTQDFAKMSMSSTGPYVPPQAEKVQGKWPDPIEQAKARKAPVPDKGTQEEGSKGQSEAIDSSGYNVSEVRKLWQQAAKDAPPPMPILKYGINMPLAAESDSSNTMAPDMRNAYVRHGMHRPIAGVGKATMYNPGLPGGGEEGHEASGGGGGHESGSQQDNQ